ncbi:interferon lambda receptor 1 isoform X2 [Rhinatrema bivittatum]|uniref:interferon lambda receptor 1 isoform X2 n=1 Tax=Rhinatrema bivittatum TaxID=194408 RepID=UPI00112935BC|nr:interferon lambda receptor 1 isoform X2 [Rhinatrema bivittatum]
MSSLARSALLLAALLQRLTGDPAPTDPRNVTLLSRNFRVLLTWLPADNHPPDVLYSVECFQPNKWKAVCTNITETECDITCMDCGSPNKKYSARVRASSEGLLPSWKEAAPFDYYDGVELGPPELKVNDTDPELIVEAIVDVPDCMVFLFLGLKCELRWWKAGTDDHDYLNCDVDYLQINKTGYSGNYCMSARTTFSLGEQFHSAYSEPLCLMLNEETRWRIPLVIGIVLVLLAALTAAVVFVYLCAYRGTYGLNSPMALDFVHMRPTTPKQPEQREEYLAFINVQPEGKGNPVSLASSLLEDSEEEEGNCGGYTERWQAPQTEPSEEECMESESESETDSQGHRSSASNPQAGSPQALKVLAFSRDRAFLENREYFLEMDNVRDPSGCQTRGEPFTGVEGCLLHSRSPDCSQVPLPLPQLPFGTCDFTIPPATQRIPAGGVHELQRCSETTDLLALLPSVQEDIRFQTLQLSEDSGQASCSSCWDRAELMEDTAELSQPVVLGVSPGEVTRAENIHGDLEAGIGQERRCQGGGHYMSRE